MTDYTYPSVYFAYFFFTLVFGGGIYFCLRTRKHGYWGSNSEEAKYRMLEDDERAEEHRGEQR